MILCYKSATATITTLKIIAQARLGYHFRGAIKDTPDVDSAGVQIKNVDPVHDIDWPALVNTSLTGRKEPDWLQPGDVLFVARGSRNIAVCFDEMPGKAVCAPRYYLLRTRDNTVLPEYLAWYINKAPAQRYFAQSAERSFIISIRRAVLEELPVSVLGLATQRTIAHLAVAARREKLITEQLIRNREQLLRLVAQGSIQQD